MAPKRFTLPLTIAGSDPSGGAGLQADLKVFLRYGLSGAAVCTANTALPASDGFGTCDAIGRILVRTLWRHRLGGVAGVDARRHPLRSTIVRTFTVPQLGATAGYGTSTLTWNPGC